MPVMSYRSNVQSAHARWDSNKSYHGRRQARRSYGPHVARTRRPKASERYASQGFCGQARPRVSDARVNNKPGRCVDAASESAAKERKRGAGRESSAWSLLYILGTYILTANAKQNKTYEELWKRRYDLTGAMQ